LDSIPFAAAAVDLDQPCGGLYGIPSTSIRNALADMMR